MKYALRLLTDYGEEWNTSISRDPDSDVRTFVVRIEGGDGTVWEGVLKRASTPFPPPKSGGKVVNVGVADRLPSIWQQQEG